MKVYRYEIPNDADNGVFYNKHCDYELADAGLNHIPMPKEDNIYKGIYKSSCPSIADLLYWIPKDVQKRLKEKGYKLVEYETKDFFERPNNEICFNKTNYIYRRVLNNE